MGDWQLVDTMIVDGLWDAFNGCHMGVTAENIAKKYDFTRDEQDAFAADSSQQKTEARRSAGASPTRSSRWRSPAQGRPGGRRRVPAPGTTAETLAKLRPAFDKDGTVTAGNASGINDGAAAVVVMSERRRPLRPDAAGAHRRLRQRRRRPGDHGHRPDPGLHQVPGEGRLVVADLDLIEANEAFAAQACPSTRPWAGIPTR
jgi:acetyl-CoA C-acetyltransferase